MVIYLKTQKEIALTEAFFPILEVFSWTEWTEPHKYGIYVII